MPLFLQKVQLDPDEIVAMEMKQTEMSNYMRERAVKKIQYGDAYSSDYTEREVSEYVTDSEAELPLG